jgi:biopolymer transport protein ExbD
MKRVDAINVIPFIDIMLVLLAIVLTTATFIVEGRLDIKLPEAETTTETPPKTPLELGIDANGGLFADSRPVDLNTLSGRLDLLHNQTPIVLRVDAEARFADFVTLVDMLKARELERLTILTRKR